MPTAYLVYGKRPGTTAIDGAGHVVVGVVVGVLVVVTVPVLSAIVVGTVRVRLSLFVVAFDPERHGYQQGRVRRRAGPRRLPSPTRGPGREPPTEPFYGDAIRTCTPHARAPSRSCATPLPRETTAAYNIIMS